MIDVHKPASEYEFRGDAGDYTPTEAERAMFEDFGESFVASSMRRSTTRMGRRGGVGVGRILHERV